MSHEGERISATLIGQDSRSGCRYSGVIRHSTLSDIELVVGGEGDVIIRLTKM